MKKTFTSKQHICRCLLCLFLLPNLSACTSKFFKDSSLAKKLSFTSKNNIHLAENRRKPIENSKSSYSKEFLQDLQKTSYSSPEYETIYDKYISNPFENTNIEKNKVEKHITTLPINERKDEFKHLDKLVKTESKIDIEDAHKETNKEHTVKKSNNTKPEPIKITVPDKPEEVKEEKLEKQVKKEEKTVKAPQENISEEQIKKEEVKTVNNPEIKVKKTKEELPPPIDSPKGNSMERKVLSPDNQVDTNAPIILPIPTTELNTSTTDLPSTPSNLPLKVLEKPKTETNQPFAQPKPSDKPAESLSLDKLSTKESITVPIENKQNTAKFKEGLNAMGPATEEIKSTYKTEQSSEKTETDNKKITIPAQNTEPKLNPNLDLQNQTLKTPPPPPPAFKLN